MLVLDATNLGRDSLYDIDGQHPAMGELGTKPAVVLNGPSLDYASGGYEHQVNACHTYGVPLIADIDYLRGRPRGDFSETVHDQARDVVSWIGKMRAKFGYDLRMTVWDWPDVSHPNPTSHFVENRGNLIQRSFASANRVIDPETHEFRAFGPIDAMDFITGELYESPERIGDRWQDGWEWRLDVTLSECLKRGQQLLVGTSPYGWGRGDRDAMSKERYAQMIRYAASKEGVAGILIGWGHAIFDPTDESDSVTQAIGEAVAA